jgi:hypothetical protein
VLAAITEQFAAYISEGAVPPRLIMDWDWSGEPTPSIVWPEGPLDWSIVAFHGHHCGDFTCTQAEPIERVPGVWTEPVNGWSLSIYRSI